MSLRNWEVAVYALFLEGGATRPVHTEEIAIKCHELAQDCFSWIKYPNLPDKDVVRVALTDARKEKSGKLVRGRAGRGRGQTGHQGREPMLDGWRLTDAGTQWVLANEPRLSAELGSRAPMSIRQEVQQRLARVRSHELFKQFMDQPENFVAPVGDLADLLRCRVDAEPEVWRARIESLVNQARIAGQDDVVRFLEVCGHNLGSLGGAKR